MLEPRETSMTPLRLRMTDLLCARPIRRLGPIAWQTPRFWTVSFGERGHSYLEQRGHSYLGLTGGDNLLDTHRDSAYHRFNRGGGAGSYWEMSGDACSKIKACCKVRGKPWCMIGRAWTGLLPFSVDCWMVSWTTRRSNRFNDRQRKRTGFKRYLALEQERVAWLDPIVVPLQGTSTLCAKAANSL